MGFRDCMMRCGSQQPAQLNLRVDEHGLGRVQAMIYPSRALGAPSSGYRGVQNTRLSKGMRRGNETL